MLGLGSGITSMTNKKSNKTQHGYMLTSKDIDLIAKDVLFDNVQSNLFWKIKPETNTNYPKGLKYTIGELYESYKYDKEFRYKAFKNPLAILLGRIAYKELIDTYNVDKISVCGTGLRYGVFYAANKYNLIS